MKALVSSSIEMQDVCTMSDVELLFRPGSLNPPFFKNFSAVADAPPIMGTDKSFIQFWDNNVRCLLELLVPGGRSIRNSYQHTATSSLRPDYAFLVSKFCAFRGEEKAPDNNDDPRKGLSDKIVWAYAPAPYVLGYYATGPAFTLVAISPPSHEQNHPVVWDIAHANLRLRAHRIKNICRLINLAGLFQQLADIVRPRDAEFTVLERFYLIYFTVPTSHFRIYYSDNGTVEIAGSSVIKAYNGPDRVERINHLRKVYYLLQDKRVPNVDRLVRHFDTTVILSPRGISAPPTNEQELLAALICILEALEILHSEPQIFHRDIRWPNVIRQVDDPQRWIIIDWEDAAVPPTKAVSRLHFKRSTHSPRVFEDGDGAEVDMWSVGELIVKCGALDVSSELVELGRWMQDAGPSASEALGEIKKYKLCRASVRGAASKGLLRKNE
ncbi:hypothetical protein M378DRAFT_422151 [Amanita muscaria Koide BX008]|uniref:Protein kinase domain-containing protein n=1 Tax=Amanita muscaria (strain Koide BX008) TaxID=946122 RepID=A0A0C2WK54_AMAMK|nr:hypothetical protein M378DRAFT_422151 [Amanita muscaria Koide BX008]